MLRIIIILSFTTDTYLALFIFAISCVAIEYCVCYILVYLFYHSSLHVFTSLQAILYICKTCQEMSSYVVLFVTVGVALPQFYNNSIVIMMLQNTVAARESKDIQLAFFPTDRL